MLIEWDDNKNATNLAKHGLRFEVADDFPWWLALITDCSRVEDGETRFAEIAPVNGRLHTLIFTKRDSAVRIISFRKSNPKEVKAYETQKQTR